MNINFSKGAIASIGVPSSIINGIQGSSSDFNGQELALFLIFVQPISFDRAKVLAELQGQLSGVAKCQLAQKGNSPEFANVKLAILAQNCTIVSINH
ncbi:MAG: hypothetical protein Q7U04_00190 [Bacteriovorax sp.]|nr:hypothetical protein [Bacteriovorax sp.]